LKRQLSPYRTGPRNPRKLPHRTPINLCRGLPSHFRLRVAQVTSLLWGGTRNSAVTPIQSQGLKRQHSPYRTGPKHPRKLPHRAPMNLHRGLPSPIRLRLAQVPSPIWGGTRNSAVTPIQSQGLKRQLSPYRTGPKNPRKLPHRTPINLRGGLRSPIRLRVAQVPSPYGEGPVILQ